MKQAMDEVLTWTVSIALAFIVLGVMVWILGLVLYYWWFKGVFIFLGISITVLALLLKKLW